MVVLARRRRFIVAVRRLYASPSRLRLDRTILENNYVTVRLATQFHIHERTGLDGQHYRRNLDRFGGIRRRHLLLVLMISLFHPRAGLASRRRWPSGVPMSRPQRYQLEKHLMLKIHETKSTRNLLSNRISCTYLFSFACFVSRFSSTVLSGVCLRLRRSTTTGRYRVAATLPPGAAAGTVVPLIRRHGWPDAEKEVSSFRSFHFPNPEHDDVTYLLVFWEENKWVASKVEL